MPPTHEIVDVYLNSTIRLPKFAHHLSYLTYSRGLENEPASQISAKKMIMMMTKDQNIVLKLLILSK